MWWSCFTWYEKGPYHIWEKETAAEKKECKKDLAAHNIAHYEKDLANWEAVQVIHQLYATRGQTGGRAQFRHDEDYGAFVQKDGKGGIDWY